MDSTLPAQQNQDHSTQEHHQFESLSMSNESSKEKEISPSSIEKHTTTNFCFDPENPFYETCGIKISLRRSVLSSEKIIIHSLPEAFDHFDALRSEEIDCDAVIVVGKKRIKVHKALLIERIPYFKYLLSHNWRDSISSEFTITEIDCSLMEYILDYAYEGNLFICQSNAQDMIYAANYLGMDLVMYECAEFMGRRIRFDDVIPLLQFLRSIQFSRIDHLLLRFLDTNFVPIFLSDEFLELSIDDVSNILERNSLQIDNEIQVFEAVDRWIRVEETRVQFGPSQTQNNAVLNSSNISKRICSNAHVLIFSTGIDYGEFRENSGPFEIYDPLKNEWTKGIFEERELHVDCAIIDNKIVFIGSNKRGECTLIILDTQKNHWSEVISTGRIGYGQGIDMGVIDGRIYVINYDDDNADGDRDFVLSIDPFDDSPEWKRMANMIRDRSGPAACVLNDKYYVIGGGVGGNGRKWSDGEVYDPSSNSWSLIASMNKGRSNCAATAFNGEIYVCGGRESVGTSAHTWRSSTDVVKYSPATNSWTTLKSMNVGRSHPTLIASCGMIYSIGGWNSRHFYMQSIERYDVERDCWENIAPMSGVTGERKIICAIPVPSSFPSPLPKDQETSFMDGN